MQTQYNDPKGQIGATKAPLGLVPPYAMEQTAWVHKLGADKYGPWNWRETGVCASTYVNAILRHLNAWRDGEDLDPESGISHLAHIACSANILMDARYCSKLQDDRNTTLPHTDPAEDETIYRILKEGELVQDGDEILFGDDVWCPISTEGSYFIRDSKIFRRKVEDKAQKHVSSDISYEDDWGALDELDEDDALAEFVEDMWRELDKYAEAGVEDDWAIAGYRILKYGEVVQDGDEVYVGEGHWCPIYTTSWATPSIVRDGTYRRKLITDCDLKDEVANCDLKERQSCPECDTVASYGSNDGPCDYHKNKTCDSKPEPQEECKCGRRYVYHWLYGWICEDCDIKYPDPQP